MASLASTQPTQSSQFQASTLRKQEMSPTLTRSRSRKVQPALKQRADAFLAQAAADTDPTRKNDVPSHKRKRGSIDTQVKPRQPLGPEAEALTSKQSRKSSTTSKARPESDQEHLEAGEDLVSGPLVGEDDAEPPILRIEAKKTFKTQAATDAKEPAEKRLKIFRKQAPKTFREKLHRATTQRMTVVGRTRSDAGGYPQEDIAIVGSTGNIYTVTIGLIPTCTCPDSLKGNECKHKVYALHTVLKAPERLQYQRALLTSELHEIFASAPALPTDNNSSDETDGKRKPTDGECPICYMDFDEEHNELVWCKAACGNNMHKECFEHWAESQAGQTVKCVYCRTPWQIDARDVSELVKTRRVGADGYVNVAEQLGMTGQRDYSTYHPYWVNRQLGR